jgi:hypothetical protein
VRIARIGAFDVSLLVRHVVHKTIQRHEAMTTEEKLELRRKCLKACGWTIATIVEDAGLCPNRLVVKTPDGEVWHNANGEFYLGIIDHALPAIESDPGVALTMLDEFCKKHEASWELQRHRNWLTLCLIVLHQPEGDCIETIERSESIPEAICACIIATSEKLRGERTEER